MAASGEEGLNQLAASILVAGSCYMLMKNKNPEKEKRSCWISELNCRRAQFGAYHSTLAELEVSDAKKWKNYLRMDTQLFTALLQAVSPAIAKQDTRFRPAIPPAERLALTLRYLATGESFTSLHFQFRMGKSTVAEIIPEVCQAIFECLKEKYLVTPSTPEQWRAVSADFYSLWNFPNCLGLSKSWFAQGVGLF